MLRMIIATKLLRKDTSVPFGFADELNPNYAIEGVPSDGGVVGAWG